MAQPNVPIVNAGLLYLNGLTIGCNGQNDILYIDPGSCRDSTNTNDIIVQNRITVEGSKVGANGAYNSRIGPNILYYVYVIADSTKYNQPAGYLLDELTEEELPDVPLPQGYDMYRLVGYVMTDNTPVPNTIFVQWFEFGAGQDRQFWFKKPVNIRANLAAATSWAPVPTANVPAFPSINTTIYITVKYTPKLATNELHIIGFEQLPDPAKDGVVVIKGQVAQVELIQSIRVPVVFDTAINNSAFLYRCTSSDDLVSFDVVGFDSPF